jgi:hypothetical protein
LQLNCSTT